MNVLEINKGQKEIGGLGKGQRTAAPANESRESTHGSNRKNSGQLANKKVI